MKKEKFRAIILAVVTFVIYNLVIFVIPFVHTAVFWLSYVFTLGAWGVVIAAIIMRLSKIPEYKVDFIAFQLLD